MVVMFIQNHKCSRKGKIFIFSVKKFWKVLSELIAYCIFCNPSYMQVTALKFKRMMQYCIHMLEIEKIVIPVSINSSFPSREIYGATHSMSCKIVWVKHNRPSEQYLISGFTFEQRESRRNHEGIQKREYFL